MFFACESWAGFTNFSFPTMAFYLLLGHYAFSFHSLAACFLRLLVPASTLRLAYVPQSN
jgi:hypothetical protein